MVNNANLSELKVATDDALRRVFFFILHFFNTLVFLGKIHRESHNHQCQTHSRLHGCVDFLGRILVYLEKTFG